MARTVPGRPIVSFIAVGCSAALLHWCVVVWLVSQWQWQPLTSNVMGWLAAFGLSFTGHHRLSFRGHGNAIASSMWRFFLLSAGGFAVNELAYAMLLHWTDQRYDLMLALVLAGVAMVTYLLSRHWAFQRSPGN